jgi:alkyl sulfatase BDS1-like metallo-beta-lactamase superfamily hydrolase
MFLAVLTGRVGLKDLLLSDEIELQGSKLDLLQLFALLDRPDGRFKIITP